MYPSGNNKYRHYRMFISCVLVGKILYGKVLNPEHLKLTDATWDERVAVICLIACVAGLGLAPFWISDLISNSVEPIISQLLN